MPKKLVSLGAVMVLSLGFVVVTGCQPSANADAAAADPAPATAAEEPAADAGPSLYERLGGTYAIAAVVDALIDRLNANDALNANPGIGSRRIPERFPGLKYHLTEMVCQATGGPCTYTGKSMKDSHIGMNISASDWELMAADFKTTLDEFGVPEAEQQELFAIVGTTMGDIVVAE